MFGGINMSSINIEESFKFNNGDIIVIGCSTGPDSMALVDMLLKIRSKYNLSLVIAHVNHNLRKESVEEAEFIRKYSLDNDLMFETMTITNYGDDNFHNEARNIRYNFFEEVVLKYGANYLMTAHHGDDLIETVLMRITRGSNLNGYSGFKKIVHMDGYDIVRPLVNYTKKELEDYDIENNVKFYVDSSNSKDKYTRNRYRKYVLPFLKEEDKNIHMKYLKFSNVISEADKFIEKERNKALDKVYVDEKLDLINFKELDSFIQKEILYYLMSEFYQDDLILINDKHIDLLLNLIYSNRANSTVNLPNEVLAIKSYNTLELKRVSEQIDSYEVEFTEYVELPNNHIIEKIEATTLNSNDICRLNSSEITLPLIIRTRRLGDKISVKGLDGTKKVKDIFIDKKIKLNDRDLWPIVVDSKGRIVWLPGLKKSKYDKKKTENYDIILKYS
ncbi:MAG: tRNA lysidine(34) synthetase TilS [Firmicutes bacterium]|nr:tRNA lysidine(34) synthetase TilS [Bacillota bacterium]